MTVPTMASAVRLPDSVPIFPLDGVLLLPRGRLPLNIFEPRYLNMCDDALAGDRMIGMIQTSEETTSGEPPVFRTGCAGRITSFSEEGSRYLITLTGVCRFDVASEVATTRGYRRVVPNWDAYDGDLLEEDAEVDRPRLIAGLKAYFRKQDISVDWKAIEAASNAPLVTSLAMVCPFSPVEKQGLLEARDLAERAKMLTGLVEMALLDPSDLVRH